MARRGFLDYVLGGAVGGLEGLAQKRAADEEKARMATALARQVRMDAFEMEDRATAKEDRLEAQKDRIQAQRQRVIAGGYVPTGRDMPGAVERPFFDEQVIGGQTYRSYLTPEQFARKTAVEAAAFKNKVDPEVRTPISTVGETGLSLVNPDTGEARFVKFPTGFTPKRTGSGAAGPSAKVREAMRTAEAWFNAPNSNAAQVKLARDIFVALRESRPDATPQELMLDSYNAVNAQMKMANTAAQIDQRGRSNLPKAGGRTLSNPPGMTKPAAAEDDAFAAEWKKYNKGGK